MKLSISYSATVMFLACGLLLTGWSPPLAGQSRDEQAVAAAVEQLSRALLEGDRQALVDLTLPELSYGHSSGLLEDRAAFVEALASGTSDFHTLDISDQNITLSGDVALVRHELRAEGEDRGNAFSVHLGVLLVWQKQRGAWKLLARQAYKL